MHSTGGGPAALHLAADAQIIHLDKKGALQTSFRKEVFGKVTHNQFWLGKRLTAEGPEG